MPYPGFKPRAYRTPDRWRTYRLRHGRSAPAIDSIRFYGVIEIRPIYATTSDYLPLPVTTCDHLRLLATTCDSLQLSANNRDYLRLPVTNLPFTQLVCFGRLPLLLTSTEITDGPSVFASNKGTVASKQQISLFVSNLIVSERLAVALHRAGEYKQGKLPLSNGCSLAQGKLPLSNGCSLAQGKLPHSNGCSLAQGKLPLSNGCSLAQGKLPLSNGCSLAQGKLPLRCDHQWPSVPSAVSKQWPTLLELLASEIRELRKGAFVSSRRWLRTLRCATRGKADYTTLVKHWRNSCYEEHVRAAALNHGISLRCRNYSLQTLCLLENVWPFFFDGGAKVVWWLDYSPPIKGNQIRFLVGWPPDFHTWEPCWTMPLVSGFSRGSPVSPRPCIPAPLYIHLASPSSALMTSTLRAAQISPLYSILRRNRDRKTLYKLFTNSTLVTMASSHRTVHSHITIGTYGRQGSVDYPLKSPDITPLDLYPWGNSEQHCVRHKPRTLNHDRRDCDRLWIHLHGNCSCRLRLVCMLVVSIAERYSLVTGPRWLSASQQGEPSSVIGRVTPGFPHVEIVPGDAAGRRVFSGISRFHRPFFPVLLHNHLHRLSRPRCWQLPKSSGKYSKVLGWVQLPRRAAAIWVRVPRPSSLHWPTRSSGHCAARRIYSLRPRGPCAQSGVAWRGDLNARSDMKYLATNLTGRVVCVPASQCVRPLRHACAARAGSLSNVDFECARSTLTAQGSGGRPVVGGSRVLAPVLLMRRIFSSIVVLVIRQESVSLELRQLESCLPRVADSTVRPRGRSDVAARALAYHKGEPGSIPSGVTPGLSHVGNGPEDAADRRYLPFPLPLHSGAAPYSPRFTLIVVKRRPNHFAHVRRALSSAAFSRCCKTATNARLHQHLPRSEIE
ncbi:hypothetical protein PR048_029828 [Dryococelus australis]|uniref:Uncharacterized protein n=1 Tax=Dryococelus australis TaxID=614101 RepID=A0ABQ9G7A0_9NEOP|nr:hypothetical protein PR048_029828 [Dryococelus australis]